MEAVFMLYTILGVALVLYGLCNLVRYLRIEIEKKRESDKTYKEYKDFIKQNRL